MQIDPAVQFQGEILIAVPHMDDGVLACGGTIAMLPRKERIHVVYATDGKASPAPVVPWRDTVSRELGEVRAAEAKAAMGCLRVPEENLEFLGLPEGQLGRYQGGLIRSLKDLVRGINPSHVLLPFRYDRHVDHVVLNRAVMAASRDGRYRGSLWEYFVYWRYRLLPAGDIRKYIGARHLVEVNIGEVSAQKRAALERFRSQTTRFYAWQTRPNLTPELLRDVSNSRELFLRYDPSAPGPAVFDRSALWIRLAHRLEPALKTRKDRIAALWARGLGRNGANGG